MSTSTTLEVTTVVYGLGRTGAVPALTLHLPDTAISPRSLIAAHVQAELDRVYTTRSTSLAWHYLLNDRPDLAPAATPASTMLNLETETERAWRGLEERRFMLVVDGVAVTELDQPLRLYTNTQVAFVRLLPLVGG
jgi:hypothetical protein